MKHTLPFLFAPFLCTLVVACADPEAQTNPVSSATASTIYWSDGDSGRLDGMKFRLANVDAPETGGVGARGGAKCEFERELGYDAKEFMVALTRNADLAITSSSGKDRYEREVITLSANGQDVAEAGKAAGHLGDWPHKGRRALSKKPDWCAFAS
ncbi:MAG: thermonuclease family protein [Pseudomonadota bacterium]